MVLCLCVCVQFSAENIYSSATMLRVAARQKSDRISPSLTSPHLQLDNLTTPHSNLMLVNDFCVSHAATAQPILANARRPSVWQSALSFPLASIMAQACCRRACIAWGEAPIWGSMWQRGSKSPLMNQYVRGLSLWQCQQGNTTSHPGKRRTHLHALSSVYVCSYWNLNVSCVIP